jgi:hypothetical protein
MISDAAFCIGGKRIGEAWTPNENENSDAPHARIKTNTLDIGKTPNAFPSILIGCTVFPLRRSNHAEFIDWKPRAMPVVTAYNPKKTVKEGGAVYCYTLLTNLDL